MGLAPASIPLASSARNAPRRASSAPEVIGREPAGAVEGGETHERRRTFAATGRPNRTCQARRPTVIILGVDIGATGALAALTDKGELVDVWDMPTLRDGPAKRRSVNARSESTRLNSSHLARSRMPSSA